MLREMAALDTGFHLTGGTAASRGYLGHRFSDDLDFFVNDVPCRVGAVSHHPALGRPDAAENILANTLTKLGPGYRCQPYGSPDSKKVAFIDEKRPIVFFDLGEREEKTVLDDARGFVLSDNGHKLLVVNDRRFAIVDLKPGQKFDKPMRTTEMETVVDPRAEWKQMFTDAYRIEHIVRGRPWDVDVRSPLGEPGVAVKEGEYVLAVKRNQSPIPGPQSLRGSNLPDLRVPL